VEWRNEFELEKNDKKIDWTILYHELKVVLHKFLSLYDCLMGAFVALSTLVALSTARQPPYH
jgi:hypothetical protein